MERQPSDHCLLARSAILMCMRFIAFAVFFLSSLLVTSFAEASGKDLLRHEALSSRYSLSDQAQADNILALIRGELLSENDNALKSLVKKVSNWHNSGRDTPDFRVTRDDVILYRSQNSDGRRNEYLILLRVGPAQNRYTGKIIAATYSQADASSPAVYRIFEPELADIQLD